MSQMVEIFKKLEEAKQDANVDLDEIHSNKRPGWAMRKAAGQQAVVELENEYKQLLSKAIQKKVFLTGTPEDIKTFIGHVGELELEGLSVDASSLYRRVTDVVADCMGMRGEFSLQQFSLMNGIVGVIANENADLEVRDAACEFRQDIKSYDQLFNHIRASIRATNGDRLNVGLLNKRIVKQAINTELSDPTVLFIRGASQEEMADISLLVVGGPAQVIEVPMNPTLEWTQAIVTKAGLDVKELASSSEVKEKKTRKPRKTNTTTPTNSEEQ